MSDPVIVTLFETYGCGGAQVAQRVADHLGVPFLNQAFSSEDLEAREAEAAASEEGFFDRFSHLFRGAAAMVEDDPGLPQAQRDLAASADTNTAQVRELAGSGGVVLGRTAAHILADRPSALHVRLDGPVADRIAAAAEEAGIDPARAARRQKSEDRRRVEMAQEFYAFDAGDPVNYDLTLNATRLGVEATAHIIVSAYEAKVGAAV